MPCLLSRFAVAGLAISFLSTPGTARDSASRDVTLQDVVALKSVLEMGLSPSGDRLALSIRDGSQSVAVAETPWSNSLYVMATTQGALRQQIGTGAAPQFSPDGRRLAYYSDAGGDLQIWLYYDGKSRQLTHVTGGIEPERAAAFYQFYDPLRLAWSPDGRYVAFSSRVESIQPSAANAERSNGTPLVLDSASPPAATLSGVFAGSPSIPPLPTDGASQIFLIELATGKARQLTTAKIGCFNPDWSPSGSQIVCASAEGGRIGFGGGMTNLYVVDVGTGLQNPITHSTDTKWLPSWSSDGKKIAYWMKAGPRSAPGVRWLWSDAPASSAQLGSDFSTNRPVTAFRWLNREKVAVGFSSGISKPLVLVDVARNQSRAIAGALTDGIDRHSIAISSTGAVAWVEGPRSAVMFQPAGGRQHELFSLNPQVGDWPGKKVEILRWSNRSGTLLEGAFIRPPNYQKGRQYPLIVDPYPLVGVSLSTTAMGSSFALASKGYVVFWPSPRSPNSPISYFKGERYDQAALYRDGWDVTFDDIMSGVDQLIALGDVDPDRMCLYGFSNGGGVVNEMITRSDRFKCAVSVAGYMPNWIDPFLMNPLGSISTYQIGNMTPWTDPQGLIKLSPVFRANKVKTPLLLAVGDRDRNFLLGTISMYNGIRYNKGNAILLRYPGQGHGFTGDSLDDFWKRVYQFFSKYLDGRGDQAKDN